MEGITCAQFTFFNNFDSANLAKVEFVPQNESIVNKQNLAKCLLSEEIDAEFNIWTKPDCYGTEYENGNRTWFYFGLKAPDSSLMVKFNLVDLNRQGKMYSQGMAPVYRILPGKPKWDRIQDKPVYSLNDDIFTLTFKFRTPENRDSIMYFAFTYPFSFTDLERMLVGIDSKYLNIKPICDDDIYYVRETVCRSIEGRAIDLITISSFHGITKEKETKLKHLFLDNVHRPFKFVGKKVIFVSARVHPGETPSSFVFNGLLSLLLNREDIIAQNLRKTFVFKMIPFLNPDGVANGHYRTDNRGVNLNRVYLNPSLREHPSIYAARALIRYYHFGFEKEDVIPTCDNCKEGKFGIDSLLDEDVQQKVSKISLEERNSDMPWCTKCKNSILKLEDTMPGISSIVPTFNLNMAIGHNFCRNCGRSLQHSKSKEEIAPEKIVVGQGDVNSNESGLFMYMDLHGHASKKGIFMYGNHFADLDRKVECMLLPKLLSMNNHHFHFNSCNFTERNMYLKDKRDGMSRAGSGRVAVLSITGIIKSYTLECNYNTGRITNILPPTAKENKGQISSVPVPPKYTPHIFEEVGRSLGASILDLVGNNPFSRLPNSEFRTLSGLREWLRTMSTEFGIENRPKVKVRCGSGGLLTQGKASRNSKIRPTVPKPALKRTKALSLGRKENVTQTNKSGIRLTKCLKAKSRKDLTLRSKNSGPLDKAKTMAKSKKNKNVLSPHKVKLDLNAKIPNVKEKLTKEGDSIHLREICFIKNDEGKTVIAKYENDNYDDSLVVSWDKSSKAHLFTHKTRVSSAPPYLKNISEPGTSNQGVVRVHNFSKNTIGKSKVKKNLRRLASAADVLGKIDKKKKKLKSK